MQFNGYSRTAACVADSLVLKHLCSDSIRKVFVSLQSKSHAPQPFNNLLFHKKSTRLICRLRLKAEKLNM